MIDASSSVIPNNVRIYVVMPTLGGSHLSETCKKLLSSLGEFDKLYVIYNGDSVTGLKEQIDDARLIYLTTKPHGASVGRNIGIQHIHQLDPASGGVIFANDRSVYSRESLSVARRFLEFHSNKIGLGTWKTPDGKTVLEPRAVYSSKTDLLRAYEPAMLVPLSLISKGLLWKDNLGPGPKTKFKSGDGAMFLMNSISLGAELVGLSQFEVENPISNFELNLRKLVVKGFQYGSGYIAYVRFSKKENRLGRLSVIPFVLAPMARYISRNPYWSENGFMWTFSSTVGRLWGLLIKNKFSDFHG